jgi:hypothetical protein
MIEYALRNLLVNDDRIITLVDDKVYYAMAPQDTESPYIVLYKISGVRLHSHDGFSSLTDCRFQFSIFADTYLESKQIAQAIQAVLDGFKGVEEESGIHIQKCLYINEVDMYEAGFHTIACDYEITHREIIESY